MALPDMEFGDRFSVQSMRGSRYMLTLLKVGAKESGLFVRMDDGRVARLDAAALNWETFEPVEKVGAALRKGDELLIESTSGAVRGELEGAPDGKVHIRLPIGVPLFVPVEDIRQVYLLFKARNLKRGDHMTVKSKSGNEYRGEISALGAGNTVKLNLHTGGSTNIRLQKVDLSSLLVAIPLDEAAVRESVAAW